MIYMSVLFTKKPQSQQNVLSTEGLIQKKKNCMWVHFETMLKFKVYRIELPKLELYLTIPKIFIRI